MKELLLLEEYLTENGLNISSQEFERERMIEFISRPAESGSAVVATKTFLENISQGFLIAFGA
jgi:hypothetical protein